MFSSNDRLELILESIITIEERMAAIKNDGDFIATKEGLTILDAITMRLQSIGENLVR